MASMDKLAKELKTLIDDSDSRKPKPFDTQAEVVKVDGETAWVHIPGGVESTPVKLTTNAKKGDMVQVRIANGSGWLVGNVTAPPTDDTKAYEAISLSDEAFKEARRARSAADSAEAEAIRAVEAANEATSAAAIADSKATAASTAAASAQSSADAASQAAATADSKATAASTAAASAQSSADAASQAAATADSKATAAGTAAATAEANAQTAITNAAAASSAAATAEANAQTAITNAATAEANAQTAITNAATAEANAQTAIANAATAEANAQTAITNAGLAQTAADSAQVSADAATTLADEAKTSATSAATAASDANTAAEAAQDSADKSTYHLSEIEQVIDVLNWVSTHGEYQLTNDTEITDGKWYFELIDGNYIVSNPVSNPHDEGFYELTNVDSAISNYIGTHLYLDGVGLHVREDDDNGAQLIITGSAIYLVNAQGDTIAQYSDSVILGDYLGSHIELSPTYGLGFYQSEKIEEGGVPINRIAYIDDDKLFIQNAQLTDTLQVGDFAWIVSSSRVSLKYNPI